MPTFAELRSGYADLWERMEIRTERHALVTAIAFKLMRHSARYKAVAGQTGVPWFLIAALHERESSADFSTYLGNGEPLSRKTTLVPRGRGPFRSWEEGAIDALALDGLDRVKDWGPERACYEAEKFNGFGYRGRGLNSPYLWSFSNHYMRGKYVADGRFSADAIDAQCGVAPLMRRLMELDASARFPGTARAPDSNRRPETIGAGGVVLGGGAATQQAISTGASLETIMALVAITAVTAAGTYAAVRFFRNRG